MNDCYSELTSLTLGGPLEVSGVILGRAGIKSSTFKGEDRKGWFSAGRVLLVQERRMGWTCRVWRSWAKMTHKRSSF